MEQLTTLEETWIRKY